MMPLQTRQTHVLNVRSGNFPGEKPARRWRPPTSALTPAITKGPCGARTRDPQIKSLLLLRMLT